MRGGKREGAGRKPGVPNKVTRDIKELAQEYGERAIIRLAQIMETESFPPAAQVAAARELLNRGFGQPQQSTDLTNSDGSLRIPGYAVVPEQAKDMGAWTQQVRSSSQIQAEE
jgi:hypothetical protein